MALMAYTKEHIQNYMIKFINTLRTDFRFTLRKMSNEYMYPEPPTSAC